MIVEDWGLIDYEQALQKQTDYVEKVAADEAHEGYLIFCSHPQVVTTGRQTKDDDIFSWNGPIVEVSRGGRATYHGPSQVVVYPIVSLKRPRGDRGPQEVRGFIRSLESAIVTTLNNFGLKAHGKTITANTSAENNLEDTGVWIGEKKVASIGIAVRRWVTYHGAAVNVLNDPTAFQGINPCGYKSDVMVSVENCLKEKFDLEAFKQDLKAQCLRLL